MQESLPSGPECAYFAWNMSEETIQSTDLQATNRFTCDNTVLNAVDDHLNKKTWSNTNCYFLRWRTRFVAIMRHLAEPCPRKSESDMNPVPQMATIIAS